MSFCNILPIGVITAMTSQQTRDVDPMLVLCGARQWTLNVELTSRVCGLNRHISKRTWYDNNHTHYSSLCWGYRFDFWSQSSAIVILEFTVDWTMTDSVTWDNVDRQPSQRWTNGNRFSAGTVFIRQNLTSVDVRLWRVKTVPALTELKYL